MKRQTTNFPYPSWYLDAVCGKGQWSLIQACDKNGEICGVLPYKRTYKWGLPIIVPPPLSPRLGPHVFYPEHLQLHEKEKFEHKILTDLAAQLPFSLYSRIQWPYTLTNGLPWQKLGWQQEERLSYQLGLWHGRKQLYKRFKPQLRNKIAKAERLLKISSTNDILPLLQLMQLAADHRQQKLPVQPKTVERVIAAGLANDLAKLWIAKNDQGEIVGAHFLIWDDTSAYNLFLESHPSFRSTGAAPALLWHGMQFAIEKSLQVYDFEGSHIPGVAAFFQTFGAMPKTYLRFTKKNWLLRWMDI